MRRLSLAVLTVLSAHISLAAAAQDLPRPPCQAAPSPPFADPARPPDIRVWRERDLPPGWTVPVCDAWPAQPARLVAALAGSFPHHGDGDALLARFGAISSLASVRYWSVTSKRWRPLIDDAHALAGADDGRPRGDFTPAEMKSGVPLFYAQDDSRSSGRVVYRMRLVSFAPDRFVLALDNVSPVRFFLVPLFPAGALKALYVLARRAPGVWDYYSLNLVGADAAGMADDLPASYANRAAALFRHVAAIPTDAEPPAAP